MTSPRADLAALAAAPADLLVIGGGITGAAIARDAAMRGLRTMLVEQYDLAWGTSSRSSRLIHGGLRYLEQRDFRLVFEASRERRILLRIAPHLVRPLPFIFPVHRRGRLFLSRLAAGMWLYDLLALFRNVRWHRMLGKRGILKAEPLIRARDLVGGARYYDAQCDDARLVAATARSAMAHGAQVANWMRVEQLEIVDGRVRGARLRDQLTGEVGLVRAITVVNATGPWGDRIRRLEFPHAEPMLRLTRGAHVSVPRARIGHHHAVTITSPLDGRVMFILPWGDLSIIGTTDTDTSQTGDTVAPSAEDVTYLLRSANAFYPNARLTEDDVVAAWAGLRALVEEDGGQAGASQVSREHRIQQGPNGMWTIAGGKLTTCRSMAEEMVDLVVKELRGFGRRGFAPCDTAGQPLPGGEAADLEPFRRTGLEVGLSAASVEHLLRQYGTEAAAVYNLCREDRSLAEPLAPPHAAIRAEVVHVTRRELARRVEDVLVRRLHLFHETRDHGAGIAREVAALMGSQLGWDDARIEEEAGKYRDTVSREP